MVALPRFDKPALLLPKLADKRITAILNKAETLGSDLFYFIYSDEDTALCIFATLNSTIGALFGEIYGRSYGGGVLDLKVYETKKIPVMIDCKSLQIPTKIDSLIIAIHARIKAEEYLESIKSTKKGQPGILELEARKKLKEAIEAEKRAQKELDEAVYDILDLTEKERRQVEEGLKELQELRRARTGA